nr:EAL domain-containing protein [Lachnospiraceae bacterium]
MSINTRFESILDKFETVKIFVAIRRGLMGILPVILIGALTLALREIPYQPYRDFCNNFSGGIIRAVYDMTYNTTFGMLSLYFTISMSYQLTIIYEIERVISRVGWCVSSLICYFVAIGMPQMENMEPLGAKGMFSAIMAVTVSSIFLNYLFKKLNVEKSVITSVELKMGQALKLLLPMAIVIVGFILLNHVFCTVTHEANFYNWLHNVFSNSMNSIPFRFLKALAFVVASSLLWMLGIHGSDVLESVAKQAFVPLDAVTGNEILTRPFLNNFVLLGGSGASICLLFALLLFAKHKHSKGLAKMAILPSLFNINEIFVYGLPIIYNPFMLIPFLAVPIICFLTTYLSMAAGFVPPPLYEVEWTTPIIVSGYLTTGSIAGSVIQIINIALGTLIYVPFMQMNERHEAQNLPKDCFRMQQILMKAEERGTTVNLSVDPVLSVTAKAIMAELKDAIRNNEIEMYYQPQFHADGSCIGAEALLRWKAELVGYLYPPLIIQLAYEGGFLMDLEKCIVRNCLKDARDFENYPNLKGKKVSINVTGTTIQIGEFQKYLLQEAERNQIKNLNICLEITEKTALSMDNNLYEAFGSLCNAGYTLAVDDFSMGSTSMKYLTGNYFKIIKLDGFLVREIVNNPRCYEIISHVIKLSESIDAEIIAEFVATEEIRDKLLEARCKIFQGGLYSFAITKE